MALSNDYASENLKDLIAEEVLVAHERVEIGLWKHIAEHLEASGANFVEGNVELFEIWCTDEGLG